MRYNSFIHVDGDDDNQLFRSNVSQFVNDNETHPILKYKAFIVAFILIITGLFILLLFNYDKILEHPFWKHLFLPISELRNKYTSNTLRDEDIFGYDYKYNETDASIFREAIEGMATTTKDGKATTKSGEFISADTESAEKKKKTPCATDCNDYVELKGKINDLSKYVKAVKDQGDDVKQTSEKLQELGKQIEDLNKSLSPGGQVKISI
jgi:hypothetical protein